MDMLDHFWTYLDIFGHFWTVVGRFEICDPPSPFKVIKYVVYGCTLSCTDSICILRLELKMHL